MIFDVTKDDFKVLLLESGSDDIASLEGLMGKECTYLKTDSASEAVRILRESNGNAALVLVGNSSEGRDPLTGAFNLSGLRKQFEEMKSQLFAGNYLFMYSDLKNFKYFNSIFGYEQGNYLLKFWCAAIRRFLGENDLICRITGDQIITVLHDCSVSKAKKMFVDVLGIMRDKFSAEFGDYTINILAGIYNYVPMQNRGETFDEIIGYARQAQKSVKNKEMSGIAVFDDDMWKTQQRIIEINGHLEAAIAGHEIKVYFQPQYNYVTGELLGAECLCRWEHKSLGFISPAEFIPALEESGKIYQLDYYVWDFACRVIKSWLERGKEISLAVNVSRKDMDYADLPSVFQHLVQTHEIPPELLRIEITESVFVDQANKLSDLIRRFSDLGFHVEMDDFGSGFSSLNLLHNIDVDVLKLDMSFLKESNTNGRSGSIINAIVKMAHTLDINVLAEGVETVEQAEFLKNIGCLIAQGYLFSKPMPLDDFNRLVENSGTNALMEGYSKMQLFNLQELFDRRSSGFFIFNNCMGPGMMLEYNGRTLQPVIVNDAFLKLIDWERETLEKHRKDLFAVFTESKRSNLLETLNECKLNHYSNCEVYLSRLERYLSAYFRLVAETEDSVIIFVEAADITGKKKMEALNTEINNLNGQNSAAVDELFDNIPMGAFSYSGERNQEFYMISKGLVSMLGFKSEEEFRAAYQNSFLHFVHPDDIDRVLREIEDHLVVSNDDYCEYRVIAADGSIMWLYDKGKVVSDGEGNRLFYVAVSDITEYKKVQLARQDNEENLVSKLRLGAQQDPMTKLYNHKFSLDMIAESMSRGEKGMLMIIDVDDFKWINDNKGHVFGDYVLCEFAKLLQNLFRSQDVVGRYGGDEFICYIVGTESRSVATRKASEIVKKASEIVLADDRRLSVSVGITITSPEIADVKQLVEQADEALYEVKRRGKRGAKIYSDIKE